jgi:glycosyltransferase involved in cell wall biosynthesis
MIVAESPRIREVASRYNSNVIVMPNCVNIDAIDMTKFVDAMKNKDNTIINIGRIEPIKGTLDLVQAFSIFYKYHPDWKLRIIGPLTNKGYVLEVQNLINKLKLQEAATIVGPKFGDDLYMEMAKAHTYCIASHPLGDGRNNTLPYAIYFGCQPVVTDVGDMREAIEPLGIKCVKPQEPISLAMGFEKAIIDKKKIKDMRQHIRETLDWSNYLPQLNHIFKEPETPETIRIDLPPH